MSNLGLRYLGALLTLSTLAAPAMAQVDLPKKKSGESKAEPKAEEKPREGRAKENAPHLVCTICYERNYATPVDAKDEDGLQSAHCMICRQVTIHRQPEKTRKQSGGIDLPEQGEQEQETQSGRADSALDPSAPETRMAVARGYFDSLERLKSVDTRLVDQAVESLVLIGAEGIAAARMALLSDKAPVFSAALQVLLRSKEASDHDLVLQRLQARLPVAAAAFAIDELVRLDPVRASPAFLARMLEHSQSHVRAAAELQLREKANPELLPLLHPVLTAPLADTRGRALDLAILCGGPGLLEVLLDRLPDPSATVASRAVAALAASTDERAEFELLSLAFRDRWILRDNAYAILALMEREDRQMNPLLHEGQLEALLGGLAANDPFVAGTCAAALAGIGFRASQQIDSQWLDRDVPDRLVATVAGHIYFNDFSSLRSTAQRRLKNIAGIDFGGDGPKWADWWIAERESFRASRATLYVKEGDERSLEVYYRSGGSEAAIFQLLGPDVQQRAQSALIGETLFLTAVEAGEVVELLRLEGVLSAQCLPGQRGSANDGGRTLELRLAGQSKLFAFAPGHSEPWFDLACAHAIALRDRNRWQRYPNAEKHTDRLGLWTEQAEYWNNTADERERALALKNLVLEYLPSVPATEWQGGIAELERLQSEHQVLGLTDFSALMGLLDSERYFTQRAQRLLALTEVAGGVRSASGDETALARGELLLDLLVKRFEADAAEAIAALMVNGGSERVRSAAGDARVLLRSIAAVVLARENTPENIAALLGLLRDSSEEVEIAAVTALGSAHIEEGRTELLVRARLGTHNVRAAALRAVGELGGESVLDALTVALTDPSPDLKLAAAEGLALLPDARAIPMLVSLLRQGRSAPWYQPVRAGLLRQGAAAEESLLSMLRAPNLEMQREAALLLAVRRRPESVPSLMRVLDADPADRAVADELAFLTCVDFRASEKPAAAWIEWWEGVVHDDPIAWLRAALQQAGFATPAANEFVTPVSRAVIDVLLEALRAAPEHVVERARRELSGLLGRDLGALPEAGVGRSAWLERVEESVRRSRD